MCSGMLYENHLWEEQKKNLKVVFTIGINKWLSKFFTPLNCQQIKWSPSKEPRLSAAISRIKRKGKKNMNDTKINLNMKEKTFLDIKLRVTQPLLSVKQ